MDLKNVKVFSWIANTDEHIIAEIPFLYLNRPNKELEKSSSWTLLSMINEVCHMYEIGSREIKRIMIYSSIVLLRETSTQEFIPKNGSTCYVKETFS